MQGMGHKKWCIPDMYLPEPHTRAIVSHETVCLVNTGKEDAVVYMTAVFEDDRPALQIEGIRIAPIRSLHVRMDDVKALRGVSVPVGVPYSLIVQSTQNVVVEYSRLNWIDGEATTFAVMAYFED